MANDLTQINPYYWRYWNTNIVANGKKFTTLYRDFDTIEDACNYIRKAVTAIQNSIK